MLAEQQQADGQLSGAAQARSAELVQAVVELEQLDEASLRRCWQSLVRSPLPVNLGRPLTLRVLAFKLQAQQLGDLDKASTRELAMIASARGSQDPADGSASPPDALKRQRSASPSLAKPRLVVRPGTMLMREHGGVQHRVMVLDQGVAWNGKTYDSLSQVALAITGTRWNGPRFFGLRDKAASGRNRPPSQSRNRKGPGAISRHRALLPTEAHP